MSKRGCAERGYGEGMATGLARTRPTRPQLWALVVGLVLGVLAMHHLAAHHGAADLDADHHAGYVHDAEPAAGGDEGLTRGLADSGLSYIGFGAPDPSVSSAAPMSASVDTGGPTAGALALLPIGSSRDALGDVGAICLAVLGSLAFVAMAMSVPRATATRRGTAGRPPGSKTAAHGPPASVPARLARLQVLRL